MAVGRLRDLLVLVGTLCATLAAAARAQDNGGDWRDLGAQTYATICAACHQPDGRGVPGAFPPLAGHVPSLIARAGGRDYLARLVVYGMSGGIDVDGVTFNAVMPPWGAVLNDAQLAAALNFVLNSWDNDSQLPPGTAPITSAEIAAARQKTITSEDVHALRGQMMPPRQAVAETMVPPAFTADQANRGRVAFRRNCQDCHGAHLNDGEFGGAPLNGTYFRKHWGNGSVAALFSFMRTKMPPDRPGKLNPQTYADMTAFLLSSNGYAPTAEELPPEPEAQARMTLQR